VIAATRTNQLTPPKDDELELSLFGPGFGECCVLHLGDGEWFVVDSCLNGETRRSIALDYLEFLGVDVATAVKMVVVTHWHDDHVRGIDQLAEHCVGAEFWCSEALRCEEFLALFELTFTRPDIHITRGVQCIGKVVDLVGDQLNFAMADMRIFQKTIAGRQVQIWSLSPSQLENLHAKKNLTELTKPSSIPQRRVPDKDPNHTAVALAVMVEDDQMLLGADLEELGNPKLGWSAVLSSPRRPADIKATLFKVPHHGSINGHHEETWKELLVKKPISFLTPYNKKKFLPDPDDVKRILARSSEAFITRTSFTKQSKAPLATRRLARMQSLVLSPGHIRARKASADSEWRVELFENASSLKTLNSR